ncbi:hypothetical protein OESDEN_11105 [Oesophagostomum dentatum]|uniref:Uncharacterized protein n=1 Tax=Oesophagostomum dentatum TaxID=61180 RepID=A0A0B1T002_OESDE|nr:hypothetical protein OESDEN_11105 [Oesophagostomum dentatum]
MVLEKNYSSGFSTDCLSLFRLSQLYPCFCQQLLSGGKPPLILKINQTSVYFSKTHRLPPPMEKLEK